MVSNRLGIVPDPADFLSGDLCEIPLMVNVEKFFGLVGIQKQPLGIDEFQGIPFHRVVTCRDRDRTPRADCGGADLDRGDGTDTNIYGLASSRQQAGKNSVSHHVSGLPRIPPHQNRAPAKIRPQGAGERS
jgi:hypothetical protein